VSDVLATEPLSEVRAFDHNKSTQTK